MDQGRQTRLPIHEADSDNGPIHSSQGHAMARFLRRRSLAQLCTAALAAIAFANLPALAANAAGERSHKTAKSEVTRSRCRTSAAVRRRPPPNATDGCTGNVREGPTPGHVRGIHRGHNREGAERHRRSSKINRQSRPWLQSAASIYHASMHLSSYFQIGLSACEGKPTASH